MTEPTSPARTTDAWVDVGPLTDLPDGGCVAVADDRVLLIRDDTRIIAFVNRCLHRDTPLHEGHVSGTTLACPLHHWRYDLRDGTLVGGDAQLPPVPVEVQGGRVLVEPPDEPRASISALLHEHARTWSRDDPAPSRSATASTIVGTRRPPSNEEPR